MAKTSYAFSLNLFIKVKSAPFLYHFLYSTKNHCVPHKWRTMSHIMSFIWPKKSLGFLLSVVDNFPILWRYLLDKNHWKIAYTAFLPSLPSSSVINLISHIKNFYLDFHFALGNLYGNKFPCLHKYVAYSTLINSETRCILLRNFL